MRLLKASWVGLAVAAAVEGLRAALPAVPDAVLDNGVFRPVANGEGVVWRDGKAPKALEGFMGGFLVGLLDEVVLDQSMPARSSIVTWAGQWEKLG